MPPPIALAESPERIGLRIVMVYLALYADLTRRLSALGLTSPSRLTALRHIAARPGCSQSELAELTGLSRVSAMTMVDQLEQAQFVERRAGANARTNALYLTDRGRAVIENANEQTAINDELIFGVLSREERRSLLRTLEKVIHHVEEARAGAKQAAKLLEGGKV
ncbi:MAG: winged helix-turn-helix transcriptional regulator [Hydrogenophilaceae bacterium]|jgi:DNA-binding MarR family transcriptional regulator|nr:winged helix-turn-helix transcriptional regulator [Hydrogenophilaceae bacterium]